MDKYFTVSVGSEIPTLEGFLKVKAIHPQRFICG